LKTVFLYLQELNRQVILKIQGETALAIDENKYKVLCQTTFLPAITADLIPLLKDYFDSVREEACIVTEFIVTYFLTHEPQLTKEQSDMIMMLRGNLSIGWSSNMASPLKQLADAEAELVEWLFGDVKDWVRQIITCMMHEPSTKESLSRVLRKINKSLPFLLMNDYRLAHASNSL